MMFILSFIFWFDSYSYILIACHKSIGPLADLLDRGWRRSGSYLYQPEMERTCCPSYTIRLRAADFIPSKEQLRVSRRMRRYSKVLEVKSFASQLFLLCYILQFFYFFIFFFIIFMLGNLSKARPFGPTSIK
jgi:hypothetical protein